MNVPESNADHGFVCARSVPYPSGWRRDLCRAVCCLGTCDEPGKIERTLFTLLLIRMLEHNACFLDEDRRFKVVCPFLLLGIKQLFQLVVLVKNKKQQIKNVDVQSYNTEQNAAKVIL